MKKAELSTKTVIILLIILVSSLVLLSRFKGDITGYATLDLPHISGYNESIILEFNQAGEQIIYLDLDNHNYTTAFFDITGSPTTLSELDRTREVYPLNPVVDVLDNGVIDWKYLIASDIFPLI